MTTIAIVTPNLPLLRSLSREAKAHRCTVWETTGARRFLADIRDQEPDAVILDLAAGGIATIEAIRSQAPAVPLLALTTWDREPEMVAAYAAGVDDYQEIRTPPEEILARIERMLARVALLRPSNEQPRWLQATPTLTIDQHAPYARVEETEVYLGLVNWRVLQCLARTPGQCTPRRDLVRALGPSGSENYLHVVIRTLRLRLGVERIQTVAGQGYWLAAS